MLSRLALAVSSVIACAVPAHAGPAPAREDDGITIPLAGDRLSGVALPIEPITGDASFKALRASAWTVDDTQRLLLEGDVVVRLARNEFRAEAAVVWINRVPTARGLVTQIAVYFDRLVESTRRAGSGTEGRELLVTVTLRGRTTVDAASIEQVRPDGALRRRAEGVLRDALRRTVAAPPPLSRRPRVESSADRTTTPDDLPSTITLPGTDEPEWLRDPRATITLAAERIDFAAGGTEGVVTAVGGIVIDYEAEGRSDLGEDGPRQLTLRAERAVLFVVPGRVPDLVERRFTAEDVYGVYLEGDVTVSADADRYHVRSPHVYYDFGTGRAVMVDAVLRTYARRGVPIVARAAELRQIAEDRWEGRDMRVAASDFHTGHISLGAKRMTVTRPPAGADDADTRIVAESIDLRAGDVPFFWWPGYDGTVDDVPLRGVSGGYSDDKGVALETRWNPFTLFGIRRPDGLDGTLRLDGFTERGPGVGLELDYARSGLSASTDLYLLHDDGTDRTSAGRDVDQDDELRGLALAESAWKPARNWSLKSEIAYISDPSFVSAWREDDFRERREYRTGVQAKHQDDRAAFTLVADDSLNDFISNDWLLASQAYTVDRLPEATYRRYGDPIFGESMLLSSETRLGQVRFSLEESTPAELGVRARAFGLADDDQRIADALRAQGYRTDAVLRFDTRHELSAPFDWGGVRIVPFGVARFTAYDDDFVEYGGNDDQMRAWGAIGVRASTVFQHVDDGVESRFLDLHRMRHLIEPSVSLWYAESGVDDGDLPIYDPGVESLATGAVIRLGLANTWQTERGGPGVRRSVDWLSFDTALVLSSDDANRESPISRFFEYRPEYSQMGDHLETSTVWQVTDALTLANLLTWDLEDSTMTRSSVGAELQHTGNLTTFAEYRMLQPDHTELLDLGFRYRISALYRIALSPQWDFREGDFRAFNVSVTRTFPDFDFVFRARYDQITDETSVGAAMSLAQF